MQNEVKKLEKDNQQLKEHLASVGKPLQPDYEATRDRALAKLKMGKQSTSGKAIEAFIKELKHGL
ncbi:MAG TPA: hypothetical protein VE944_21305 [Nostoc sp.]|uniref:hypothetical protein n=1 Tax=Nostoc sp. TaxID=1180 RepID=UPI002D4C07D9|nr:hypothetical protein [Nostoc sp.]HYX16838.1 hypothetical protein [Nostoc sp.]